MDARLNTTGNRAGSGDGRLPDPGEPGRRGEIGLRWWVGDDLAIHLGWPETGCEAGCAAIGWVAADGAYGVVEVPSNLLPKPVLDVIDGRFPGRRWFQGTWDEGSGDAGDGLTTRAA